ncbi:hypothetical protein ARALYDRAFT_901469 [Arabidopsis lyrata subsp. lyrata]|uniref:Uncharacterized protein n=1 Tax=Arabidopsis lyrata subsp. lyrata TaxID=81972 RepID=D7LET3_ARALL|nr:hypothetical protein ARALYDRAFT_901469 [Arabidopsis lyrata subsp. lyrata]
MVHIPQDLLVNIISHVGKYGFRYLGTLIASTKETKNEVFSPLVLQSVDLSEFKTESSMVQYESGIETISHIWNLVPRWEDAVVVADMVMEQIVRMGPVGAGIYFNSFHYPVDDIPHCTYIHCAADNVCEDCFGLWYSLIIRPIC